MGFFIEVPANKINLVERVLGDRVEALFGINQTHFENYTYYHTHPETGNRFYRIETQLYDGEWKDFESYVIDNFPTLPRYDHAYIRAFTNVEEP